MIYGMVWVFPICVNIPSNDVKTRLQGVHMYRPTIVWKLGIPILHMQPLVNFIKQVVIFLWQVKRCYSSKKVSENEFKHHLHLKKNYNFSAILD